MPDLLIELFSEEIPARMQGRAAEDLKKRMTDGLVDAGLTYVSAAAFSTPRRLTLTVQGLLAASPNLREERKGPRVDAPDKAIEGFLRGAGLTRDQLEERDTPKGAVFFATIEKPGRPAAEIIAEVLDTVIRNFPWPKSMRWGAGSLRWVRPLHSILCILTDEAGAQVVPFSIEGITAGNTTHGHRFMAPAQFSVTSFDDYEARLKRANVVLSPTERADHIWADAGNLAFAAGFELVEDRALLSEVAGLVEWPVVLMGEIGADFLDLPPEVLQTSMREHQKFFSVRNPKTGRIERFVTVANRDTDDQGTTILAGNQKVLSARLADAKFFWENDLRVAKSDMSVWTQSLENVTFHNKLGSQGDRIRRIAALSRELADATGADPKQAETAAELAKADLSSEMVYEFPELQGLMGRYYIAAAGQDAAIAAVAQDHYSPLGPSDDVPTAPLSVTVALADKLDALTGFWAIDEKPTGSKDPFALRRAALGVIRLVLENSISLSLNTFVSKSVLSLCLNLSDGTPSFFKELPVHWSPENGDIEPHQPWKEAPLSQFVLDDPKDEVFISLIDHSLSGLAYNLMDEHPENYEAVREAERVFDERLGLLDSLIGASCFPVSDGGSVLAKLWEIESYHRVWRTAADRISESLLAFIHDRLKVFLRDDGIRHDIIDACIAMPGNDDLNLLVKRARALNDVLKTEDGENLLQGFKRANNILIQAEAKDGVEYSYGADIKFADSDAETALFTAMGDAEPKIARALKAEDFPTAMAAMAGLRAPIDGFFDKVQVNDDNQTLRRNRLNLLSQIRTLCSSVADLTHIGG